MRGVGDVGDIPGLIDNSVRGVDLRGACLAVHGAREVPEHVVRSAARPLRGEVQAGHDRLTIERVDGNVALGGRRELRDQPTLRVLDLQADVRRHDGAAVRERRIGDRHLHWRRLEIALTGREQHVLPDRPRVVVVALRAGERERGGRRVPVAAVAREDQPVLAVDPRAVRDNAADWAFGAKSTGLSDPSPSSRATR